jgi:D-arabinose 1-dehydrogenase-like Zn-dependent alcohol dehydrogenase
MPQRPGSAIIQMALKAHAEKNDMVKVKAAVLVEPGRIALIEKPIPHVGPLDALIRLATTTICGTDVRILKGEYRGQRA